LTILLATLLRIKKCGTGKGAMKGEKKGELAGLAGRDGEAKPGKGEVARGETPQ
jgi:hypothetical protein